MLFLLNILGKLYEQIHKWVDLNCSWNYVPQKNRRKDDSANFRGGPLYKSSHTAETITPSSSWLDGFNKGNLGAFNMRVYSHISLVNPPKFPMLDPGLQGKHMNTNRLSNNNAYHALIDLLQSAQAELVIKVF